MKVLRQDEVNGEIALQFDDGQCIRMTPQQGWELSEQLRACLLDGIRTSDAPVTRNVERAGKQFAVAVSINDPFWSRFNAGSWEPSTFQVFDDLIDAGSVYIDIGAWIGPTALYAAQIAARSFAFEPDPIAFRELKANVELNGKAPWADRLRVFNKAVAPSSGTMMLGSRGAGGDSMSSALFADHGTSWEVETTSLSDFMEAESLQDAKIFLKVDIEGGEFELLPGSRSVLGRENITLLLSLHPEFLRNKPVLGEGGSMRSGFKRRWVDARQSARLIRELPFKYVYHLDGRRVALSAEVIKTMLTGRRLNEVVASHKPWAALRMSEGRSHIES